MNKRIRKTIAAFFVVAMFLIPSTMFVNATVPIREGYKDDGYQDIDTAPLTSQKYAVIMVGRYFGGWMTLFDLFNPENLLDILDTIQQYYTWYLNDAGRLYTTLHNTYGYDDENIFLLVRLLPEEIWIPGIGNYNFEIPETFDPDWNDYNENLGNLEENLETVLGDFRPDGENELSEDDSLFFCFIDHGGIEDVNYYCNDYSYNEFISPLGNSAGTWKDEYKAYDTYTVYSHYTYHDTSTGAVFSQLFRNGWSDTLTLTRTDETKIIKGFRIYARNENHLDQMNVTFYNDNTPVKSVILTEWPNYKYKYVEFEGEEIEVNKVKIKFHENDPIFGFGLHWAVVRDFNFWESDSDGEVGDTFFGCPLETIPGSLGAIFGNDKEKLYDYELKSYVGDYNFDGIKAKVIYALQPCMSGGFISELSGTNRIICTASRGFEFADEWISQFRRALDKVDESSGPNQDQPGSDGIPDADLYPQDGKISILEAYRYAANFVAENRPGEQHPLIDDNGDYSGRVGHHFFETNYYDPYDPAKDGYIAANTFL